MLVAFVLVVSCLQYDLARCHAPMFDGTDRTLPKNLKDNTITDRIQENNIMEVKTDKTMSLFEGDIELMSQDKGHVDTSQTGNAEKADVDVNGLTSKRKAIRSRKKIWPSRTIPIQLTSELASARVNIIKVLKEIQDHSCLKFRDKENGDKNWIKMVKKSG
ncbi:uncharacterized protein LOC116298872 [Actinia tenebrosa]|uniref:Uncharacterized protein LOC116298872 n=1 Tax=Actinia tenebrosa TaxID=6105 RepID=A0A6P8ICA4_ACTTE|nr:uncharacterized protein LOC116298872 [Actinia tenebrosa]